MKKHNSKTFLLPIILSVIVTFTINPFVKTTHAATVSDTQDKNQSINIKLDSYDNVNSAANNFTLTNTGDTVELSKLKLRYYFTSDENSDGQAFSCYYSCVSGLKDKNNNITDYVHGTFQKLDKPVENADSYLEINFDKDAGTFDSSNVLTLNTSINNTNWSKVNTDDDYSFNDVSKIIVLINDEVVNGTAPKSKEDMLPRITIGGVTAEGGEFFNVPINITNIKDKGLTKFHIKFSYDPDLFNLYGSNTDIPHIPDYDYDAVTIKNSSAFYHTMELAYDYAKSKKTNASYEEGEYAHLTLQAKENVEDSLYYLKVLVEPTLTDANGNEYSGDSIILDNEPITLKYNKDIPKDSVILKNYLHFNEDNVEDTNIPIKTYENTVKYIKCASTDLDSHVLKPGTDYDLSSDTLTLKESLLKTLLGKNAYITIKFDHGLSQSIFINNSNFNSLSDPLRSGFSNDEENVSVATIDSPEFHRLFPITIAITNTSNIDIYNRLLEVNYYFNRKISDNDNFRLDYCSIIGSNKDLRYSSYVDGIYPIDKDSNENSYFSTSFEYSAGFLKPGETLVMMFHYEGSSSTSIRPLYEPVVTYKYDSLYGTRHEYILGNAEILSDDIELSSEENSDTAVELKLNTNALTSIDAYSEGNFIKTLEKGTDYIQSKRSEIILTKAYLNSIDKDTALKFKFSNEHDSTLNIIKH